jgi:hypothetical protein
MSRPKVVLCGHCHNPHPIHDPDCPNKPIDPGIGTTTGDGPVSDTSFSAMSFDQLVGILEASRQARQWVEGQLTEAIELQTAVNDIDAYNDSTENP